MTQIKQAKLGNITKEVDLISKKEDISPEVISKEIANGKIAVVKNNIHNIIPCGVGKGLKTKINANIGTSPKKFDIEEEIEKLKVIEDAGADTYMDLSTGGNLDEIRNALISKARIPLGTVPIYQAMVEARRKYGSEMKMTKEELFQVIEKQCSAGVDFITVHCGVTYRSLEKLEKNKRIAGIVSRGGSFLYKWIKENEKENPLFSDYERLVEIAKKYDVVLSLGDGLRPGAIADATDDGQIEELKILGELAKIALDNDVGIIIEGPGHVPIDEIEKNIKLQKEYCNGAPFYILGPLPTDIAPGYDHLVSAIGGALAGSYGADFLCYVTPSEHLGLPSQDEVREGVIYSKIAAHIADIAKYGKKARSWDDNMSKARKALDWEKQFELCIDPKKAKEIYNRKKVEDIETCTMCGEFCSLK